MRNAFVLVLVAGCAGGPSPDLAPRGTTDCPELDSCAIATGGDVVADAQTESKEPALVDSVAVTPDGILEAVALADHSGVTFHALAAGTAHVHAELHTTGNTMTFDRDVRVADIATTRILPAFYPNGVGAPPSHLAAFTGAAVDLRVSYHDAGGMPMLGSGLENWATTSGTLTTVLAHGDDADSERLRTFEVGDATAVITANTATLTIDSRPAGSTKTLDLGACAWLGTDGAILPVATGDRLDVVAIAADGLAILGVSPSGPPTFTVDDPTLVGLTPVDESFTVTAIATGSTTLHLSFDGAASTFQLGVQ